MVYIKVLTNLKSFMELIKNNYILNTYELFSINFRRLQLFLNNSSYKVFNNSRTLDTKEFKQFHRSSLK